ncbi:colicin I receptor precursor [bacterium BMS3Abin04]|nr:colicin I receptor precursor [bacterium BMS3Abin04]
MKIHPLIFCLILFSNLLFAQNNLSVLVKDSKTNSPLVGANVYFNSLNTGGATDENGFAEIKSIPNGKYTLTVSYIGYKTETLELKFPRKNQSETITVLLKPEGVKSEEVIVTSTRTNGVVEDSPVKVEVLGQDEVNEEIAIRPGNISKLLSETSGVIVQQTSGVSGVVSFRLEGLPGAYTQLLKDGLPLLNQFSSGLTLLQIPPLDLQQVEVVKGASSIFYGDGAVGGFVNIVTRKPANKHEFDLVVNQTHKKGTDISSFYSNKYGKFGFTMLASLSRQSPVDVDGDGFTDIPKFRQITINPKLFWDISNTANIEFGINAFFGDRSGGDISAIENGPDSLHSYIERNKSNRFNTILNFNKSFSNGSELKFKNNIYYYNRDISISNNNFSGRQIYSFNELSYLTEVGNHKAVFGADFIADNFREPADVSNPYSYNRTTFGFFAQDDWQLTSRLILQPGLRIDYNNIYNSALLPHLSMMYKISNSLNVRISGGSAYLTPSIFNYSDSRDLVKHNISFSKNVSMSKANSLNLDFGYKLIIDEFVLKLNQAFFYTNIKNAVIPNYLASESIPLLINNSNSSLVTKGFDTNFYVALDELELFADYSYADVNKTVNGITAPLELTPKNKLNLTLTYEEEGEWRTGLEAFYTGKQYLEDETYSSSYWLLGAMFDKMFKNFSVILNVENILDERQSKYENIVLPPYSNPTFSPLYMPIDGIVANIAVWIRLK